jgi:hypothetical protein
VTKDIETITYGQRVSRHSLPTYVFYFLSLALFKQF